MSESTSGRPGPCETADLAALAGRIRRLIDATVTSRPPEDAVRAAARAVDQAIAHLAPHVTDPPPPRYPGHGAGPLAVKDIFPYDVVLGELNPLAVPMAIEWRDPVAIGTVRFGTPYEGPPGCVHGAVIAGAFDQVFNAVNLMRGNPGPTRRLEIRYLKATPLHRELRFEGEQERTEGREVFTTGRLLADGVVTVEARGVFVQVSAERVQQLLAPRGQRTSTE
jgi:hypothetical protein